MDHQKYIKEVIKVSENAVEHGNEPFGALLVDKDGNIVLTAENTVFTDQDKTKHAELNLCSLASKKFDRKFLEECTLYASTEPCAMCAGAIFWIGVKTVVFACSSKAFFELLSKKKKERGLGIPCNHIFDHAAGHKVNVIGPILEEEAMKDDYVFVVGIDGFRYDYIEKYNSKFNLQFLNALIETGVTNERLIPMFPTKTFPNHYSLVTGLHTETHGIVNNDMYDPTFNATFKMSSPEALKSRWGKNLYFKLGEPIWVTAEKQKVTTGIVFWPGSEVEIKGVRPTYYTKFNQSMSHEERVNRLLSFLDTRNPSRLGMLYFDIVDTMGHHHGPDSAQVGVALKSVDDAIGMLLRGLQSRNLMNRVNIIVVSDHGMTSWTEEKRIFLDDYIEEHMDDIRMIDNSDGKGFGPIGSILVKNKQLTDTIVRKLSNRHPHLKCYAKKDIPKRLHYQNSVRIPEIICIASEGYSVGFRRYGRTIFGKGTHGYDNAVKSMSGVFIANGPRFKNGYRTGAFENIQLYNILAKILNLIPAPNHGSLDKVADIFAEDGKRGGMSLKELLEIKQFKIGKDISELLINLYPKIEE